MILVVTKFIGYIQNDKEAAGYSQSKSEQIDGGQNFVPGKSTEKGFEGLHEILMQET